MHTQVFEDLYRETHGLSPRKKRPASIRDSSSSSSTADTERSGDDQDAEAGVAAGAETAEDTDEDTAAVEGEDGRLVDDGDVARLLAELQADFDTEDGSGLEAGEPGADGEAPEIVTGKDTEQESALADGGIGCAESRNHAQHGEVLQKTASGLEASGISSSPACQQDGAKQDGGEVLATRGGSRTQLEEDRHAAADGGQRAAGGNESRSTQRRVDISRMKIDAPERGARTGPRPQSAPSACLSSGKFSRLSRASSSHLARAVSQKVLQATKEAEERASSEARQGEDMRHRAPGSASARENDRSHATRRRGDASSQVRTTVQSLRVLFSTGNAYFSWTRWVYCRRYG